jgi:SAM-dependent methyltransferase
MISRPQSAQWDRHWQSGERKWFLWGMVATRRFVFQPAVAFYCDRFFSERGLFFEMGCGTAESSALIPRKLRKFIGLDFSAAALGLARKTGSLDALVQADALNLPCSSGSIDGIWNLGVMEHFDLSQIQRCFAEFRRVLKRGGVIIAFWPTERNVSRWFLGPIEWLISRTSGRHFVFFPDEVSRLRSKEQAASYLRGAGLEVLALDFNWRTAFIHRVVVARKVS